MGLIHTPTRPENLSASPLLIHLSTAAAHSSSIFLLCKHLSYSLRCLRHLTINILLAVPCTNLVKYQAKVHNQMGKSLITTPDLSMPQSMIKQIRLQIPDAILLLNVNGSKATWKLPISLTWKPYARSNWTISEDIFLTRVLVLGPLEKYFRMASNVASSEELLDLRVWTRDCNQTQDIH